MEPDIKSQLHGIQSFLLYIDSDSAGDKDTAKTVLVMFSTMVIKLYGRKVGIVYEEETGHSVHLSHERKGDESFPFSLRSQMCRRRRLTLLEFRICTNFAKNEKAAASVIRIY